MKTDLKFAAEVQERSGQNIKLCYQCLKCSVGCPLSSHMEFNPNRVIRMIQYGQREKVLRSHAIWLCVSCMTCGVRCPNEIDIARVMESLRWLAAAEKSEPAEKGIELFHRLFLIRCRLGEHPVM